MKKMDNITLFYMNLIIDYPMIEKVRYFKLPQPIIREQKINPLTKGLHLTEMGEIIIPDGDTWSIQEEKNDFLLVYCSRGEAKITIDKEAVLIQGGQFYIAAADRKVEFSSGVNKQSRFLIAWFNGENIRFLEKDFSLIRNVVPSVKNLIANREMLFDEIFNNLSKGFHDENLEYINFCFGHLLATFLYGYKTDKPDDGESGHAVRRAIQYFENNIHNKLTLNQIAEEVGYSATYFSTIFRKETGYAPLSYFSHIKIVKACEYLDHTSSKVKQVSFSLGYTDPYYFARDFKKKMGLSPRQYRNRISSRLIITRKDPDS